jgi:hypothetical protein
LADPTLMEIHLLERPTSFGRECFGRGVFGAGVWSLRAGGGG